jgi:hypothetical protein
LKTELDESKQFVEQQSYQIMGLEQEKEKLEEVLEENKENTLSLEVIKAEEIELNEKLRYEQKECLCLLNDMQVDQDDQLRLEDQIVEIKDQYQKVNDAFDRIIDWQGVYKDPPTTFPSYSRKEKIKDQVFFDTWKPLLKYIQAIQETTTKACKRLWNTSDDLFEEFRMQVDAPH